MKIYLAPMEGLADVYLRELIANCGGYDLVVTEFIRVVDILLPKHVFYKKVPELKRQCTTTNGTPVRVQLLGNNPSALADNAGRAIELGSHGLDVNFGCPSKTVNASKGGAILLKEPQTIYNVIQAVRQAVPKGQTLSAKMRLGYEDTSTLWECAHAIADAGADEVVVHARTKLQGYKPPAYWHLVEEFEQKLGIPVVINGEIWNHQDSAAALKAAKCKALMIGRGAVRDPNLANQIKSNIEGSSWAQMMPLVQSFWQQIAENMPEKYAAGRLKQWLKFIRENHSEAHDLFMELRSKTEVADITRIIESLE